MRRLATILLVLGFLSGACGRETIVVVVSQPTPTDPISTSPPGITTLPRSPTTAPVAPTIATTTTVTTTIASSTASTTTSTVADSGPTPLVSGTVVLVHHPEYIKDSFDLRVGQATTEMPWSMGQLEDLAVLPTDGGSLLFKGMLSIAGEAAPGYEGCSVEPAAPMPVDEDGWGLVPLTTMTFGLGQYFCMYTAPHVEPRYPNADHPGLVAQLYLVEVTAESITFDYVTWDWPG